MRIKAPVCSIIWKDDRLVELTVKAPAGWFPGTEVISMILKMMNGLVLWNRKPSPSALQETVGALYTAQKMVYTYPSGYVHLGCPRVRTSAFSFHIIGNALLYRRGYGPHIPVFVIFFFLFLFLLLPNHFSFIFQPTRLFWLAPLPLSINTTCSIIWKPLINEKNPINDYSYNKPPVRRRLPFRDNSTEVDIGFFAGTEDFIWSGRLDYSGHPSWITSVN